MVDLNQQDTVTVRILNSTPSQFLCKVSFSLYATHVAVYIPLAQKRTKWLRPSVGMVFAAASCLVVAWIFQDFGEATSLCLLGSQFQEEKSQVRVDGL
jgi:peptidoglycan/LPS O-acetylase OafA/YrhL